MYDVISHGRRFYRTLVASSDNAYCYPDMPCTLFLPGDRPRLVAGDPRTPSSAHPSLLITRTLTKQLGTQTYLPERLMRGLIPAALLEAYAFWQNPDGSLTAYPKPDAPLATRSTRLQLSSPGGAGRHRVWQRRRHPHPYARGRLSPCARQAIAASLSSPHGLRTRPHLRRPDHGTGGRRATEAMDGTGSGLRKEEREEHSWLCALAEADLSRPRLTLLNLMHAPEGSSLRAVASVFLRLENLSHILAWSETPSASVDDLTTIDLIELPRLRLLPRSVRTDTSRLRRALGLSVSTHPTLAPTRCSARCPSLLLGLPMASTTYSSPPRCRSARCCTLPLSTQLVPGRSNAQWLTPALTPARALPLSSPRCSTVPRWLAQCCAPRTSTRCTSAS